MNDDRAIYANMEPHLFEVMQEVQVGLTLSGIPEVYARWWATGALFATVAFLKQQLRDSNKGLADIAAEIEQEQDRRKRRAQWRQKITLVILLASLTMGFLLLAM
jgi:hypothetical protein